MGKERKGLVQTVVDAASAISEITDSSSVLSKKKVHLDRLYEISTHFIELADEENDKSPNSKEIPPEPKKIYSERISSDIGFMSAPPKEQKTNNDRVSCGSSFMDIFSCTGFASMCGSSSKTIGNTEDKSFSTPPLEEGLLERDIYLDHTIPSVIDIEYDRTDISSIRERQKEQTMKKSSGMDVCDVLSLENSDDKNQRNSTYKVVIRWEGTEQCSVISDHSL